MPIIWFTRKPSNRGSRTSKPCRIVFTPKPKGLRFNTELTKAIAAMDVGYLRIGIDDDENLLFLIPQASSEDAFKVSIAKNSGQVSSASIGDWAAENGMLGKSAIGTWDEESKQFIFNLAQPDADA